MEELEAVNHLLAIYEAMNGNPPGNFYAEFWDLLVERRDDLTRSRDAGHDRSISSGRFSGETEGQIMGATLL